MNKIFEMANSNVEASFLTVDALFLKEKNYSAVDFYKKFGFQTMYPPTSSNTIRMFTTLFHQ